MPGLTNKSAAFSVSTWFGIAGGIATQENWKSWVDNERPLLSHLDNPQLETVPSRVSRRLSTLGKSVLRCCEKCIPMCVPNTAVLSVSRHGDLVSQDKLIETVRTYNDVSPTAFSYSVHNRFSSLVSMFAGYHGVNAAYSSVRDGFPLAIAEAVSLIEADPDRTVMVLAYEPETPERYDEIINTTWLPHVVAFVLEKPGVQRNTCRLIRHSTNVPGTSESGTGLVFLRAILEGKSTRDGFWEYFVES